MQDADRWLYAAGSSQDSQPVLSAKPEQALMKPQHLLQQLAESQRDKGSLVQHSVNAYLLNCQYLTFISPLGLAIVRLK